MKEVCMTIPSSKEFVGPVVRFLDDFFSNKDVQQTVVSNVVTAVIEAIGNAVVHGNHHDLSKQVHIRFRIHQNCLTVEVRDEGEGFDATNLPDPLAPENILKPCGRGIFLIKSFMDEVSFSSDDTGSTILFTKSFEHNIETAS